MAWECADCGEKEREGVKIPVCHHCGKPVCTRHREQINDDAFGAGEISAAPRVAVHCLDCRRDFHPRAINLEAGTQPARGVAAP
jgi:hypothetical protein